MDVCQMAVRTRKSPGTAPRRGGPLAISSRLQTKSRPDLIAIQEVRPVAPLQRPALQPVQEEVDHQVDRKQVGQHHEAARRVLSQDAYHLALGWRQRDHLYCVWFT